MNESDETMAAGPPEPRTFASGRYVVRTLLGEGGQKSVFLVHDRELDRDCALSLIKTDLLDPEDIVRLRREAQTMARLTHGNVVTIHDIGEDDGKPYIVCEYVAGGDLRQELRQAEGPLPLHRAVALGEDLCRALAVAHEQGIVHRDLKPANVWLTKQGSAKLGDLGIARPADRSRVTMTGTVLGTAAYMAPEMAQGQEATPRSDLYSLGCVLYELVTGRPPFVGGDPMAIVSQHVHAEPSPPSEHNLAVPEGLERLILRLLAKAPEARPASADEVLAELEGIETALPSPTPTLRVRRLARLWANPLFRVAAPAVLVALIAGGVVGGIVMSRSGGGDAAGSAFREVTYHYFNETTPVVESGDCQSEDLVTSGEAVGEASGDITGGLVSDYRSVLYANECQSGAVTSMVTITDSAGNELYMLVDGPNSVTTAQEAIAFVGSLVLTVKGGTGIYEGAIGSGTCSQLTTGPATAELGPTGSFRTEGDCTFQLATEDAATGTQPLIVELAASPTEVAIFGSSADLPTNVAVIVLYGNIQEETHRGLSLRLREPEGAQIQAAARGSDDEPSSGERVWSLPDVPPGEFLRFEFTLQFLAAEPAVVPLVVEIEGEDLERPVRSDPVTINVVQ